MKMMSYSDRSKKTEVELCKLERFFEREIKSTYLVLLNKQVLYISDDFQQAREEFSRHAYE